MDFMLIDRLEEEFFDEHGYIKRKIDANKCLQIIAEIKASLPQTIAEAESIVKNKNMILENASAVAKKAIASAERKAQSLITEDAVNKRIQAETQKVITRAISQRDVLFDKTKIHLEGMFEDTERVLLHMLTTIRKNKQELRTYELK